MIVNEPPFIIRNSKAILAQSCEALFNAIAGNLPVAGLFGQSHSFSSLRLVLERSFIHEEFVVAIWRAGERSCEIRLNELP